MLILDRTLDESTVEAIAGMAVPPTRDRTIILNDLVRGLKDDHVWSKLDCLYLLAAHDSQAARINVRAPANNIISAVNSPAFTNDRGFTGDGSSALLVTNFNPAIGSPQYSLNSAAFGVWSRTNNMGGFDLGQSGSTSGINSRASTASTLRGVVNYSISANYGSTADSLGHHCVSRTASNLTSGYKAGSLVGTSPIAPIEVGNDSFYILRGVTLTSYSSRQIAAVHIGSGLAAVEVARLYARLNNYLSAIGAA